jgi:ceramide glucosyltransferase
MFHIFIVAAQALLALLTLCGIGYYILCLWSARSFLRADRPPEGFTPPVSILKPLRGTDREIYESFRSHCEQDYPEYEIIFGVSEPNDPAIPVVERLIREHSQRDIRLIVCPQALGTNTKVSNLIQMLPHARYPHLLVNDSDIRVGRDYLRRVMSPFADPNVGLVTSLYRGAAGATLGSELESIGISTDFSAGVLAARQIEGGVHFALGSTLAFSREALAAIGGFEPLVDYLADDFEMGARISAAGFRVVLADVVVETFLPDYSIRAFLQHQMRWARSTRDSRRWGYLGLGLTFGLPWAMLAVVAARGALWSWALLAAALMVRLAMAVVVGVAAVHDTAVLRRLWLLPLRDLVALGVWVASYAGHTVAWRGDEFILKDGKLRPA